MARSSSTKILVALYLLAIVTANLAVARFGQPALIVTAFVLIPFDLCTRDALHESWRGKRLAVKMAALIASGSLLAYLVNQDAGRVAIASFAAFAVAGTVDTFVYGLMHKRSIMRRMNTSNAASSVTDSIVFPLVAFGMMDPWLSASQAASKFVGGIVWTYLYVKWRSHVET